MTQAGAVLDRVRSVRAGIEEIEGRAARWALLGLLYGVGGLLTYLVVFEGIMQLAYGRVSVGPVDVGRYPQSLPRGVFIDGAVFGMLYGLLGVGIILVYRANRIVNFAQAQLGAVPAAVGLLLISNKGWNYFAVIPIVLVGSALLGAGVDRVVVSRFRTAPRLILTVVSIGVGFVLIAAEFFVKLALADDLLASSTTPVETPWQAHRFEIGIYTMDGDRIAAVVAVLVVATAIALLLRYTDIGIAIRASAENGERASMLGIPVARVSTVVWTLAAVVSGVGVFLRAPMVGLPLSGSIGYAILLYGLAAAVLAKMESIPRALIGGVLIGAVDRAAIFSERSSAIAEATMLVLILGALLLQRKSFARAGDSGEATWQAVKEIRPVPVELRTLPEVRRAKVLVGVVVGVMAVALPFVVGAAQVGRVTQLVIYGIVAVSLVVLTGLSGQISLGQWAIAGVGAAAAGGLAANHNLDFFVTLVVAALAGAFAAIVVGLPALRVQGLFLAVTTLAAAFTVQNIVLDARYFSWLLPGDFAFVERPVLYQSFDIDVSTEILWFEVSGDIKYYFLCLLFLGLTAMVTRSVRRNRSGRVFIGVRDNVKLLQAFGVSPARTRLASFALSGAIAGLAGGLYAYQSRTVEAETYTAAFGVQLFAVVVIGGMTTVTGALLGTFVVLGLPLLPGVREIDQIDLLLAGFGLVLIPLLLPGGLAAGVFRLRDEWLRKVAARHDLHVPSLVADSLVADPDPDPLVPTAPDGLDLPDGLVSA